MVDATFFGDICIPSMLEGEVDFVVGESFFFFEYRCAAFRYVVYYLLLLADSFSVDWHQFVFYQMLSAFWNVSIEVVVLFCALICFIAVLVC